MLALPIVLFRLLLLGLLLGGGPQAAHGGAPALARHYWRDTPGTAPAPEQLVAVVHGSLLAAADESAPGFSNVWWVPNGETAPVGPAHWALKMAVPCAPGFAHGNGQRQRLRTSIFPNAP